MITPEDIDERIRDWLRAELKKRGHGAKKELAEYLRLDNQDVITRLIAKPGQKRKAVKTFPIDLLPAMEDHFNSSPLLGMKKVPIVGLAGAGPEGTVRFATGDGNFGEVDAPIDSSPTTVALEVRGNSMYGVANDGWIIFYEDREEPSREHMGELCVCWLEDERVLVKIPQPGSEHGLFNLESANAPTMRDVPVRYFSIVTDIKTRRAAKRYVKRNPATEVVDVPLAPKLPDLTKITRKFIDQFSEAAEYSEHEKQQLEEALANRLTDNDRGSARGGAHGMSQKRAAKGRNDE